MDRARNTRRFAAVVVLLLSLLPRQSSQAQSIEGLCIDQSPSNRLVTWQAFVSDGFITQGRIPGFNHAAYASSTTTLATSEVVERVQINYAFPASYLRSVDIYWIVGEYPGGLPLPNIQVKASGVSYLGTSRLDSPSQDFVGRLVAGSARFDYSLSVVDNVTVTVDLFHDNSQTYNIFLGIGNLCTADAATPTPVVTNTPTQTGTATNTPVNTNTPTTTLTPPPTSTGSPYPTPTSAEAVETVTGGFRDMPTPRNCGGDLNPCSGEFPIGVPGFPELDLQSPTPIAVITGTPTYASGGTAVALAGSLDNVAGALGGMADSLSTNAAPLVVLDAKGTPINVAEAASQIGGSIGTGISYIRALPNLYLGKMGTLVVFIIFCLLLMLAVKGTIIILAVIKRIVQFIIDLLGAVKII